MSKPYTLHLVGRKSVKIIERFESSVLIEYVKTGVQSSINPRLIKTIKK